ncbi:MAG: RsmB/NOP family class I SAM-dependent RNA methyltransferase [Desulfovibrio sp.]|nr:RsmB/NOP family class I SAM-dependent RNA methyltransferase [Desulfovibrio sp.]
MSVVKKMRSFRLVCDESEKKNVEELLEAEGYRFEDEPFSPWCKRLLEEPKPLGSSLAAFFGYAYIQDRSSMLPPLALAPDRGSAILDMCASPGSKTGFLAQLTGSEGFVLANEPNPARLATLRANVAASNLFQIATCSYPGEKTPLTPGSWKYILLDPPCSGWGTEEKNPRARKIWKGDKISRLTAIQRALLKRAATLLAPGGRLLYSTCTTNPAENEEQTLYAESLGLIREPLAEFKGFSFLPSVAGCLLVNGKESSAQGFYLSLLRKPDGEAPASDKELFSVNYFDISRLASPFADVSSLVGGKTAIFGDKIYWLPDGAFELLPRNFKWRGFPVGKMREDKGRSLFIPDSRARRLARKDGSVVIWERIEQAREFLAGRAVGVSAEGVASLYWRDLPLGFAPVKSGRLIASFRDSGR